MSLDIHKLSLDDDGGGDDEEQEEEEQDNTHAEGMSDEDYLELLILVEGQKREKKARCRAEMERIEDDCGEERKKAVEKANEILAGGSVPAGSGGDVAREAARALGGGTGYTQAAWRAYAQCMKKADAEACNFLPPPFTAEAEQLKEENARRDK